ncbi:aldehyde dehydrogenase family protein [Clostridium oryzae]|uniref:Aldehyde dehydrogenase n=1 Tax=Clostridium oryzae TaxID=1450648 RepID=A0A1V4ICV4_9CLOT|nr:aldehyde dehydrogenase family protein [Clostridium oryzae]OPJ57838.1 aldehyde dehydrogenase [Clostridium oryzae]
MEKDFSEIKNEIDEIFVLQQKNRWKLRKTTAADRIKKLKKLMRVIIESKEEIEEALFMDFKKPAEEVLLTEIYATTSAIKHTIANLKKWMKPKRVIAPISYIGAKCKIMYEPKGVSLIISPWNFPFQLTMDPLIAAVAAGNCVVLKPSEYSTASTECIKKIVSRVFPKEEVYVFDGDYKVSQMLLEKPFDNIFFTGSPTVGKIVMEAASKHLTDVTLELGGKSPVIVDESADLEKAAQRIIWGKCLNAGQICVAPDYLLVPKNIEKEFVALLIRYIKKFYGTMESFSDEKNFCSIINNKHFKRVKALIEDAVDRGGRIELGGSYQEDKNFISPTIITNVDENSEILEEEIFGPVLPVLTYDSLEEAIEYVRSKPKPLALYIFSSSNKKIQCLLQHTESGDVAINDVVLHVGNHKLPFGGFNNSGIGKTHGFNGFMAFTHERSYLKQGKHSAMSMFYPPFKQNTKKLIEKLIKYL